MEKILSQFPRLETGRPGFAGIGFCLGATPSKKENFRIAVHTLTREYGALVGELIRLLLEAKVPVDLDFTTIQVFLNPEMHPHEDQNCGASCSVALGPFTGGHLNVAGTSHNIRHSPLVYDGRLTHYAEPFVGDRWSLTLFTHPKWADLHDGDKAFLSSLGFHLPMRMPPHTILPQVPATEPLPTIYIDNKIPAPKVPAAVQGVDHSIQVILFELFLSVPVGALALKSANIRFIHYTIIPGVDCDHS